jgi:hypothetical protein
MPTPGPALAGVAAALQALQKQVDRLARRPSGGDSTHDGTGANSTAVGTGTTAGTNSTSVGDTANAQNAGTAVGYAAAAATGTWGVAVGNDSSSGSQGVAVGRYADTSLAPSGGVAVGYGTYVTGTDGIAIGDSPSSTADYGIAIGNSAHASGIGSIAIGPSASQSVDHQALIKADGLEIRGVTAGVGSVLYLYSPNGSRWVLSVDNSGVLSVAAA